MAEIPKRLIGRRRQELKGVGQQVGPHLPKEKRQEAITAAREKGRNAGDVGNVTAQLEWEAVADGLEGQ